MYNRIEKRHVSYDPRIVDGSNAVRFLVRVKELIEDPTTLLLER